MKNKICFNQLSKDELIEVIEAANLELKNRSIVTDTVKHSAKIILTELRKILSSIRETFGLDISNGVDTLEIMPTDKITITLVDEEGDDYTLISEEEED